MPTSNNTPTPEELKKLLEAHKQGKEAFAAAMQEIWKNRGKDK